MSVFTALNYTKDARVFMQVRYGNTLYDIEL